MRNHKPIAGALQIVLGLSVLLVAGLLYGGFFTGGEAQAEQAVATFSSDVVSIAGPILILLALLFFVSGFGLIRNLSWSRPVAWVAAIMGLIVNVPLGTAISVYVIWVLAKSGRDG